MPAKRAGTHVQTAGLLAGRAGLHYRQSILAVSPLSILKTFSHTHLRPMMELNYMANSPISSSDVTDNTRAILPPCRNFPHGRNAPFTSA
jgi:hypothetical protein